MARKPNVFPSYLLHKQSGQARVRINGRDFLLGPFGSDESRIAYGQLIAKLAGGVQIDPIADSKRGSLPRLESDDPGSSVGELCLVFLRHAETHYVKDGKPTSEVHILRSVISPHAQLILTKYLSANPDERLFKITGAAYLCHPPAPRLPGGVVAP